MKGNSYIYLLWFVGCGQKREPKCDFMRKFILFIKLKMKDKLLLLEAFLFLGMARLLLLTKECKEIAPRLEKHAQGDGNWETQVKKAKKVGWAVRLMCKHTVWQSKCFVQAIATKKMLNRRHIKGKIYLGVAKDENGGLIAHAWIKSCGMILTGARGMERFTVVGTFGEEDSGPHEDEGNIKREEA